MKRMQLSSPEILSLIHACEKQNTDVFLQLPAMPRAAEFERFAAAAGAPVLALLPGELHPCGAGTDLFKHSAPPETGLYYADVRALLAEEAAHAIQSAGIRFLVLPFYECAVPSEYGYKLAYAGVSNLRSALPYPLQVTGVSPGEFLTPAVFEALGTVDYVLAGEERQRNLAAFKAVSERAALYFTADLCEKYPLRRVIVQCATRRQAETLNAFLYRRGTMSRLYHGGRPPRENACALKDFNAGACGVLIATKALLANYPFINADKVFYLGLPYSLSHADRCAALSDDGGLFCVYCDEDIALHRELSAAYAEALGLPKEPFLRERARMLDDLLKIIINSEDL